MKSVLRITLLLMLPAFVFAQPHEAKLEKLHTALRNAANDTIRMDKYVVLGKYYNEINRDSALFYLAQGIAIAQKLKLKLYEANILENRGYMYAGLGNYPKALEAFFQALRIAEDPASEKYAWNLPTGQTPRSARLHTLGLTYLTMGHLYGRTGNSKRRVSNYHKSLAIAETLQDKGLNALANMNLGSAYLGLNQLDSALFYEHRASAIFLEAEGYNEYKYQGGAFHLIGRIYQAKGDYNQALDAVHKSVEAHSRVNNLTGLASSYRLLGAIYLALGKIDSSLFYARKTLDMAKTIEQPQRFAGAYQILSDVFYQLDNKDSAFIYLKLASTLHDSLNDVERNNLISYQNLGFEEQMRLQNLEEDRIRMQTKNRTYALLAGLGVFFAIGLILYRNNRQKQRTNKVLESTLTNLKATQNQLIQSEKMASLGELTAGIAHEIQNPLNFVNNFSEVSTELIEEAKEELEKGEVDESKEILKDLSQNLRKIHHHGQRASGIVKGMLEHSRTGDGVREPTDINTLLDEYVRLAYHGLRAKDKSFQAEFSMVLDPSLPKIKVVSQDIGRVFLNLINNAFYAVDKRAKAGAEGYRPSVMVSTKMYPSVEGQGDAKVQISVRDNGPGIPDDIKAKIFQPFFTTKPTGSGTGLGLSLSYDIVKAHGGTLTVESEEGAETTFAVKLPIV